MSYVICNVSPGSENIRLELTHPDGAVFGQFDRVEAHYKKAAKPLIFSMNAGMYHDDRRPVGLYIQDAQEIARLQSKPGPGSFGMVPNGVFWLKDGRAGVIETSAYADLFAEDMPDFATQSGPVLVIDGALHPAFEENGPSRKRRNGFGISHDGETLYFVISDGPVNFHAFANLFRGHLQTPNALFLDGTVSKLYTSELARNESGLDMGPIVTVSKAAKSN